MNPLAIIGTAGRDKTFPMSRTLWDKMVEHTINHVHQNQVTHVVSGGAAWADHLAVEMFLKGYVEKLTLHLPAPLEKKYVGPYKSAASAANYYHQQFSHILGRDTLKELNQAVDMEECYGSYEEAAPGYHAMFIRNMKVAKAAKSVLAFTWGRAGVADGGTKDTWNKAENALYKEHKSLLDFL